MKGTVSKSAVLLPLILGAAEAAPKKKASVSGGNSATTTYNFKKDSFGNNDVLNLGVQNQIKGGQISARDLDEILEIYVREASPKKKASVSGGNSATTTYNFKKDSFGSGDVLNLGVQNQIKGGQVQARDLEDFEFYARDSEDDLLYARDFEDDLLYARDIEEELLYVREPGGFLSGGPARGGDSKTRGGNQVNNKNNLRNMKFSGGGNILNMNTQNQVKGGNTQGGNGGANSGNGGGGGSMSVPVSLPPMPMRRWVLEERDAEPINEGLNGHSSYGRNSVTRGGNSRTNIHTSFGGSPGFSLSSSTKLKGGNVHGGAGAANTANGADAGSLTLTRRGGFLSGGTARGGDSKTTGGNRVTNSNSLKGSQFTGGGNVLNMNTVTQVKGGNTKGGKGGNNSGSGGGGGSLSVPVSLPPMPMRRDVDLEELYAREFDFGDLEAREFDDYELFARGGFMSGGTARGGNSNTRGGNQVNTKNNLKGMTFSGGGNVLNMNTQNQVKGGNTVGGKGGVNSGTGGAGGSLSVPVSLPPMPMRRDLLDLDDVYARDLEAEYELFAREAFADPEAEAEAEFFEDELEY